MFPGAVFYFVVATRIITIVFSLTKKPFFLTFWQDLNLRFIESLINLPANMKGS